MLPFENLSTDPENAFFSAGIHESTLSQLAKVSDLNVIARTSVRQYETDPPPIPEIAEALNVEMVMEGSVRYANDRVLITAQLINGQSGVHLWADEYDRDLADIFAVQAEIASNIATALEAELLPTERESIERVQSDSPDAYAAFLRAMAVAQDGIDVGAGTNTRAIIHSYLDDTLSLDPDFALAHAWKAFMYVRSRMFDPVTDEDWLDFRAEMDQLANAHINIALALDSSLGFAHAVRTQMHLNNWNGRQAQFEAEQALQLSPNYPMALFLSAQVQMLVLDQPGEAVRYLERASALDPNNAELLAELVLALHAAQRYAEAIEASQQCLALDPGGVRCALVMARSEFALGIQETPLDALRRAEQLAPADAAPAIRTLIARGYGLLGQPEDAQRILEAIRVVSADQYVHPGAWAWGYMGIGDYEEALRRLNIAAENPELMKGPYAALYTHLNIYLDPVLEQPEWVEVREKLRPLR